MDLDGLMDISILKSNINDLKFLVDSLIESSSLAEKIEIINHYPEISLFLERVPLLEQFIRENSEKEELVIKSILVIGEGPVVFEHIEKINDAKVRLRSLVDKLWEVESFYDVVGGIVGYYYTFIKVLLEKQKGDLKKDQKCRYIKPQGVDISSTNAKVDQAIVSGLQHLPEMAEIYPVGGAGDRLNLCDSEDGTPLPAAQLRFKGKTLLEGLIEDLQAREWLYYKVYGKQALVPIVLMTSHEKNNDAHIRDIFSQNGWFGRPQELFFFMIQPLVPLITEEGHWAMSEPLRPALKPGGHGVIWKLALDSGAFKWLEEKKGKKALIRQINNPIAGTDYGLLAFCGLGFLGNKVFGFASCPRKLCTAEGMNVLVECERNGEYEYRISNLEYTDFAQLGVEDVPEKPGSSYSQYPANTNILFADLQTLEKAAKRCPMPGMLINLKNGNSKHIKAGRLESTMQNISDHFVSKFPKKLREGQYDQLSTYLIYNERRKTISVTKRSYEAGKPMIETPEGCFYEMLQNNYDLLQQYCKMDIPAIPSEEAYLDQGPDWIFLFHPALGPAYSIISRKLRGGKLARWAEIQLNVVEADIKDLDISGSLVIEADSPLGKKGKNGVVLYGEECAKCELLNVKIVNKGINRKANNIYWKNQIERHESLKIVLHGNAEFFAENITINGNHRIEVPDGHRCEAINTNGKVHFRMEKISSPTWKWEYRLEGNVINLQKTQK